MSLRPRCFILSAFSALALVGCHRPPTQEEISARAAELLAEQMASKQARTDEPAAELSEADKVLLEKTNATLDETIIPRFVFTDATFKEAVEFLQHVATEKARELPDRANDMGDAEWKKAWAERWERVQAASIIFYVKSESPQYVVLGKDPVIEPLQAIQRIENQTLTMDLSDVPLREALQYAADLAGLKMKVGPGKVLFEPKD
jgi:hypothetical protein